MNHRWSRPAGALCGLMLSLLLVPADSASAGTCDRLKPMRGKVCGRRCDSQSGSVSIKFRGGDPGAVFYVMLADCVKFQVTLDSRGRADFALEDLVEVYEGYFKAIVPVEPVPEELVIRFKVCR